MAATKKNLAKRASKQAAGGQQQQQQQQPVYGGNVIPQFQAILARHCTQLMTEWLQLNQNALAAIGGEGGSGRGVGAA